MTGLPPASVPNFYQSTLDHVVVVIGARAAVDKARDRIFWCNVGAEGPMTASALEPHGIGARSFIQFPSAAAADAAITLLRVLGRTKGDPMKATWEGRLSTSVLDAFIGINASCLPSSGIQTILAYGQESIEHKGGTSTGALDKVELAEQLVNLKAEEEEVNAELSTEVESLMLLLEHFRESVMRSERAKRGYRGSLGHLKELQEALQKRLEGLLNEESRELAHFLDNLTLEAA